MVVTPDGEHIVSGSWDKTLKVWDLDTGSLLRSLEGHTGSVNAMVVTPDGEHIVSASLDKTLKVWDLANGTLLTTFAADYPLLCCGVSSAGQSLLVGDSGGRVHFLRMDNL
jgi:WD40 repeat protein